MSTKAFYTRRRPLLRTLQAIRSGTLRVGYLGGSITDPRGRERWSENVSNWLTARLPEVRLEVENVAIGATGSLSALVRMDRTVLARECDLVFVEYAVNDNGIDAVERRRSREGVLRKLLKVGCDVICTYTFSRPMLDDMEAGRVPQSIADFELLNEHYGIPSVWMAAYALDQVHRGLLRWEEWLPDDLHPTNCGSRVYAEPVCDLIEEELACENQTQAWTMPEPMDPLCWENAESVAWSDVRTQGPWRVQNQMALAGFDHVLLNYALSGAAEFDFEGQGIALTLNFGRLTPDFFWQIDGGEEQLCRLERYEWMGEEGWPRSFVLWHSEKPGRHTVRIRPAMDTDSLARGSIFEIANLGILK